ncbi:MAG: DUF3021 family protein [Mobilitalea sp.]
MDIVKRVIQTFIYILVGVVMSSTIFITIFIPEANLSYIFLWQMVAMAVICALGTFLFITKGELSKKQMLIRMILHGIYITIITMGGAIMMEWISTDSLLQVISMFLLVICVYAGVMYGMFKQEQKTAEELNMHLRKYQPTEEDESR